MQTGAVHGNPLLAGSQRWKLEPGWHLALVVVANPLRRQLDVRSQFRIDPAARIGKLRWPDLEGRPDVVAQRRGDPANGVIALVPDLANDALHERRGRERLAEHARCRRNRRLVNRHQFGRPRQQRLPHPVGPVHDPHAGAVRPDS